MYSLGQGVRVQILPTDSDEGPSWLQSRPLLAGTGLLHVLTLVTVLVYDVPQVPVHATPLHSVHSE